jgi:hypothetical protein
MQGIRRRDKTCLSLDVIAHEVAFPRGETARMPGKVGLTNSILLWKYQPFPKYNFRVRNLHDSNVTRVNLAELHEDLSHDFSMHES